MQKTKINNIPEINTIKIFFLVKKKLCHIVTKKIKSPVCGKFCVHLQFICYKT